MASPSGFTKLIKSLPKYLKVLDVGGGGLQGENTTDALLEHFGTENVTGICTSSHEVEVYQAQRAEKKLPKANIIDGNYYTHDFNEQFDLVVLDLNVENNMKDWENEFSNLTYLKKDGFLITYIIMTDEYGDPKETPALIRDHWKRFWKTEKLAPFHIGMKRIKGYEVYAHEKEERRTYILWMLLRKTSGL